MDFETFQKLMSAKQKQITEAVRKRQKWQGEDPTKVAHYTAMIEQYDREMQELWNQYSHNVVANIGVAQPGTATKGRIDPGKRRKGEGKKSQWQLHVANVAKTMKGQPFVDIIKEAKRTY